MIYKNGLIHVSHRCSYREFIAKIDRFGRGDEMPKHKWYAFVDAYINETYKPNKTNRR